MRIPDTLEKENIEDKIMDYIREGAEQRLVTTKPVGLKGVDLVIKKRGDYKGKTISFRIYSLAGVLKSEKFTIKILEDNEKPNKDFYFMFVYFDEIKQDINNIWIIPSLTFKEIVGSQIFSAETGLEDKYSKFLINKKELGDYLIGIVE